MIDPIAAEIIEHALIYAERRDGHRGAQQRLLAEHQGAARPFVRALRPRTGRLIAQAEHIPVHLGSLPWGLRRMLREIEARTRGDARGRNVGRQRSLHHRHAPQRRHADAPGLSPRRAGRLRGQQGASRRRRRLGSRFDAGRRAATSLPKGSSCRRCGSLRTIGSSTRRSRFSARTRARRTHAAAICARKSPATTPASGGSWNSAIVTARPIWPGAIDRALDDSERRMRAALRALGDGAFEARDALEDRDGRPSLTIALRLELRDGLGTASTTAAPALKLDFPAQRRLRRDAFGRVLCAARGDRSDDSDERRLLQAGRGARSGGIAAQSAPPGPGFRRQRGDEHAQRRRGAASAGESRAAARPGVQRRQR